MQNGFQQPPAFPLPGCQLRFQLVAHHHQFVYLGHDAVRIPAPLKLFPEPLSSTASHKPAWLVR
jgi:hypothetical protein